MLDKTAASAKEEPVKAEAVKRQQQKRTSREQAPK